MQSSIVSRHATLTQRAYAIGSTLAIIGGLAVIASACFTWKVRLIGNCYGQAPTAIPYYGSSIGGIFGALRGEAGTELPYPYRSMSNMALALVPGIIIGAILLFGYTFEHFGYN